jgi:hypothetical protein
MGHSLWHTENDIPDDTRNPTLADIEGNRTRRNGFLEKASFTCASWGLAARVANLSDGGSTMLLTGIRVLPPGIQYVLLSFWILTCSQVTTAS